MSIETHQQISSDLKTSILSSGYSDELPFCHAHFSPIGGDMGTERQDFRVTEIPAYLPCGSGEHLYLWIEKEGRSTMDATKAMEKAFGVKEIHIGCAGKKDVNAVTRQWISVQTPDDNKEAIDSLNTLGWLRILNTSRHTNKLRMGHLRGNRFEVNLYGVTASDDEISQACAALSSDGFLNYFGKQRFGYDGSNVAQGVRIICGGHAKHQMKKLYVSAVQSALFNLTIAKRYLTFGTSVLDGDVLQKLNAGCFVCSDPDADQPRSDAGEVTITHALPGKKVMHGHGCPEALEASVSQAFIDHWSAQLPENQFDISALSRLADGARRPMWIRPDNIQFKRINTHDISIAFVLPAGCYATVFLRHLCGASFTR